MTHKWLSSDYDQAEEFLEDTYLSGETYLNMDIAKILDGYEVDDLILAAAKQDQDEVKRILKGHVQRFIQSDVGQRILESKVYEDRMNREANHGDYLAKQLKEAFA